MSTVLVLVIAETRLMMMMKRRERMTISPAHYTERFVKPIKGEISCCLKGISVNLWRQDTPILGANVIIISCQESQRGRRVRDHCVHAHVSTLHVTVNFGLVLNLMIVSVCCFNRVSHGLGVFGKYQMADQDLNLFEQGKAVLSLLKTSNYLLATFTL